MKLAPIALFTYNRLEHTRRTLEALEANQFAGQSDLRVYSDGPRTASDATKVNHVRDYLRTVREALSSYLRTMGATVGTIPCHWGFSEPNPL